MTGEHRWNPRSAEELNAEIGADRGKFGGAARLASWAGICPGNHESGGKSKSGKTRKGSKWLRSTLTESAAAAESRPRQSFLIQVGQRAGSATGGLLNWDENRQAVPSGVRACLSPRLANLVTSCAVRADPICRVNGGQVCANSLSGEAGATPGPGA